MRRDWFGTGAILVAATAFAVWYVTASEGCDPVSGVCYQAVWWAVPSLLLVLAIGAGIMFFSISSTGTPKSQEATEAKNGTVEEPLHDWTKTLNELDAVIRATEKKILADRADVWARIQSANQSAGVEGGDVVPDGAVAGRSRQIRQADQILPERKAETSPQTENVMTQNERLFSIEQWTREAIRLSEEVLWKENDLVESRKRLLDLEEQLRSESDVLTTEWDSLVERDRSLLLAVRHLIGALGVGRVPLVDNAVRPPSSLPSVRKELSEAALGAEAPPVDQVRVTKNEAVERMKKAVQSARKNPDARDSSDVQDMLNLALVSFKAGEFEDAVRHSEEVLEILRGSPSGP